MAAVMEQVVLEAVRRSDCQYVWPHRSCVIPMLDVLQHFHPRLPTPRWLRMRERACMVALIREYGAWEAAGAAFMEFHGVADRVEPTTLAAVGDIVYFHTPAWRSIVHNGFPEGFPLIGLVGRSGWLYTKSERGMMPLPPPAYRAVSIHRPRT